MSPNIPRLSAVFLILLLLLLTFIAVNDDIRHRLHLIKKSTGTPSFRSQSTDHINPFVGSENGGNMFPGVTVPFGVVKLGIDMMPPRNAGDPYSGYHPLGNVTGFSMMHESGTGGSPKYGVVSQLPIVGVVQNPLVDYAVPRERDDEAYLGYYKSFLGNGVEVELAAEHHVGMIRHTFPEGREEKNVLVDVSHFLPSFRGLGFEQHYVGGGIRIGEDGRYRGHGIYNGGWNYGTNWTIYFCGEFDQQYLGKTFEGEGENIEYFGPKTEVSGLNKRLGALFTFPQSNHRAPLTVESKIGISWISSEKACRFIDAEIPKTNSFSSLINSSTTKWYQVLSKVSTSETNTTMLELLYTSIYGMFLIPSDRTGENPGWNSTEPYYDDIFTLWDTFRTHTPLFQILQPKRYSDFIRSLIDIWRHDSWLPDGRSSNFNGRVQGGSNSDNVLADAFVKHTPNINWRDALLAMRTNGESVPQNNNDPQAGDSSTKEGRGALTDWVEKGYITNFYTRSVSRAVEYSLNDFCIAQVARGLNESAVYETYLNRSKNWRNHWDTRMSTHDITGFLSPIFLDGSFPVVPQDPLSCDGCYWGDDYYQGLPYEYSLNAHHDMKHLIHLTGGDANFITRLELLFTPDTIDGNGAFGRTIFNPGNEPSFASPYLFNFVPGEQWRSVKHSRQIAQDYYKPTKSGLPGNSDAGAMQSWLLWTFIGLYPITGTTTFLIAAPRQEKLRIDLGGGRSFAVTAAGLDEAAGSIYVQSLKVNGQPWTKSWLEWSDIFEHGGLMEFILGPSPTSWDSSPLRPLWDLL